MLTIAYAASIGGIGTPIGTAPNLIGIGMIDKLLGIRITFFTWMLLGIPVVVTMSLILMFYLSWLYPINSVELSGLREYLQRQKESLGGWTWGQINVLLVFGIMVTLWLLPGGLALLRGSDSPQYLLVRRLLPEGVVAIIGASLLFLLPTSWRERQFTLNWQQAVRIDWGTLLLFGGGLSLGSLTFSTKLADIMGQKIIELTGAQSLWGITLVATTLAIILTETTSNTASANMVIPIFIAIAQSVGVSAIPPALGACLACSLAFMLPVSTPPNAIVYGSGLIPITKMIRTGIVLELCGIAIIVLSLRILCPLLGLV